MEKATKIYSPLRGRETLVFPKALIAMHFEDSCQTFGRLSCSVDKVLGFPKETAKSLTDCLSRFVTWGSEAGARDQDLDYRLRKSKEMHDHVVELLSQLNCLVDEGIQLLDNEFLDRLGDEDEGSQRNDDDRQEESAQAAQPTQATLRGIIDIIEAVEDIVQDLVDLAPSLNRPYPQDIDVYSSSVSNDSDDGDRAEVELARQMFPYASRTLLKRLGHANWKRRLAQNVLQQHVRSSTGRGHRAAKDNRHGKRTSRREIAEDAFSFQKPTLEATRDTAKNVPLSGLTSGPSSTAPSIVSDFTIFSKQLSAPTTSFTIPPIASSSKLEPLSHAAAGSRVIAFPRMPISLASLPVGKKHMFTCKLCGYDLEAGTKIKTEEDWRQHVLEDLEPYLCTFDECFSAQEMYAFREEWYRHELENHRIEKVFACDVCIQEFSDRHLAEQHLDSHLGELDEDEITLMKSSLWPLLSSRNVGSNHCPLCFHLVPPSETKFHIAKHLEHFALSSIVEETTSEEEDADELSRQSEGDLMSERGRKEAILNNFVSEQLKLNLVRGKQPPDHDNSNREDLDFLDDMSANGDTQDSDSLAAQHRKDSRDMLIERMFDDKQAPGTGSNRPARGDADTSTPPSLAASGHSLPLLRTWSYPRNEDFMGRDKELANLYKILSEPGRVCVVSADAGMGKTALAVEYTYRYEHCYHFIFWIQAETAVGLRESISQVALQLRLAPEGTDQEILIRLAREFLETVKDKRWMLVFDNVDIWDHIDAYMPTKTSATNGSILITTRCESLTAPSRPVNFFRITLQELDIDEGRTLLLHGLPQDLRPAESSLRDPEYKVAGEIAALAGLPLLIIYLSGYIKQSGCTLSEFWEYWNEWRPKPHVGSEAHESRDSDTLGSLFTITLRDLGGDARKILKIMAFLDSDGIQKELLTRDDGANKPGPLYLRTNRFRVIMSNLIAQKFVTETRQSRDHETYSVHRMLQARILQDMNDNPKDRDEMFRVAFDLIRYHLPRPSLDTPEPSKWNAFKEYLPHVLSLQRAYADPLSITTPTPFLGLAELFKDGGVLLWQRYIHTDALKLLTSAEKILDDLASRGGGLLDSETEKTMADLRADINVTANLLLQYFGISRRKESKERLWRNLEYRNKVIAEKSPGDVTPEDRMLLNNARADYANALLQFNDYKLAEPIYEECYETFRTFDEQSLSTQVALAKLDHHMAYCKMYRRDFPAAIALAERATAVIDRLGDKQMTLRYQFDLACIVLQSGDLDRALGLHREVLEARMALQGHASYFCLQSHYALAALCHHAGRLREAEGWMRQALRRAGERGARSFWPEAAVARTRYHLSRVLRDKAGGAATEEAQQLARDAKDVLSRMLPYDPGPIAGVREEDTLALFDHLQPVFGGRFTGLSLLKYVGEKEVEPAVSA